MKERNRSFTVVTKSYKHGRIMQRKSTMRKRSLYFAAALLTIILVLIFNTANIANAGIRETERYKYFTSIEVEAGTSLWDIAEEYICLLYTSILPIIIGMVLFLYGFFFETGIFTRLR